MVRWIALFALLLLLPPLFALSGSVDRSITAVVEQVSGETTTTKVAFYYSSTVEAPPSYVIEGNPSDLEDGAILCPNTPLTVDVSIDGYYAVDGVWHATFVPPGGRCIPPNESSVEERAFEVFSSSVRDIPSDDVGGRIDTSYKEPVEVHCEGHDTPVVSTFGVKGFVLPHVVIDIGGDRRVFEDGQEYSHASTLTGEGTKEVDVEATIERIVIARVTPQNSSIYFTSYSTYEDPLSLFSHHITLTVAHPIIEMMVVDYSPSEISSLPTEVEVEIRNNGNIPIKVVEGQAGGGLTLTPLEGFNTVIAPGSNAILSFRLEGQAVPPEGVAITLRAVGDKPYCGGEVEGEITFTIGRALVGNAQSFIDIDGTQYSGTGNSIIIGEGSHTIKFKVCTTSQMEVNSTREVVGSRVILPEESSLLTVEGCMDVRVLNFACADGENFTALHEVNAEGDTNPDDNVAIATIQCLGIQECTVEPPSKSLFPGESFTAQVVCGNGFCDSLDARTAADWLLLTVRDYFIDVSAEEGAPSGASTTIRIEASRDVGGSTIPYRCALNVFIPSMECIDYI